MSRSQSVKGPPKKFYCSGEGAPLKERESNFVSCDMNHVLSLTIQYPIEGNQMSLFETIVSSLTKEQYAVMRRFLNGGRSL